MTDTKCINCIRGPETCIKEFSCEPSAAARLFIPMYEGEDRIDIIGQNGNEGLHYGPPAVKVSNGSSASYYTLPPASLELQDLISYLNCNAQLGEIGRAWFRYGRCPHSDRIRDLNKIIFYAEAELNRIAKYEGK